MRSQMLDDSVRFGCNGCTACCNQTYRVLIEADKVHAIDAHDFSKYPQLAGMKPYHEPTDGRQGYYEIAKLDKTRCAFCDTDDLCILHKELGPEAKPHMCRQFPILRSRTTVDDRISVSYGCPAVQECKGKSLTEEASDIARLLGVTDKPADRDAVVPLDATCNLAWAESNALFDRVLTLFDPDREGDVWQRFGDLLALLVAVGEYKQSLLQETGETRSLLDLLRSDGPVPNTPEVPEIRGWARVSQVPMPVRFLFAATMYPDAVPADSVASAGLFKRLSLIPKLMTLSKLSGGYASRVLDRNVSVGDVMQYQVADHLPVASNRLLLRYYRSRLWQRYLASTRLSVLGGVHQHIQDLNAIMFMARAEAYEKRSAQLDESLIRQALQRVEFHIANQLRMYDCTLKGWLRAQLNNPALAFQSLRLMALKRAEPCPTQTSKNSDTEQVASTRLGIDTENPKPFTVRPRPAPGGR